LWLIGKGVSPALSVLIVIGLAAACGALSGLISFRLRGQALIITLGVGFVVQAIAQIITSAGSEQAGTVYGRVPGWLTDASSVQSSVFGVRIAPAVLIWVALSALVVVTLKRTVFGRGVYAMGGNSTAAERALVPEFANWVTVFTLSAVMAAVTGILLLGFSGGAFADVGQPYLFTTVTAVVVGGTSLLGGRGGYGLTVMGVGVLTVLTTVLVGLGLELPGQQAVLGLLIVPMVALYGRDPHPRTQI
jgi:ribose transport system permease protein